MTYFQQTGFSNANYTPVTKNNRTVGYSIGEKIKISYKIQQIQILEQCTVTLQCRNTVFYKNCMSTIAAINELLIGYYFWLGQVEVPF